MTEQDPQYSAILDRLRNGGLTPEEQADLLAELQERYLALDRSALAPNGLPYPQATDPVSEGASAIQTLATAISGNVLRAYSRGVPTTNEISPGPPDTAPGYRTLNGMDFTLLTSANTLITWEFMTQNGNSGATREIYGGVAIDGVMNAPSERHKMIGNANYDMVGGSVVIPTTAAQHAIAVQTRSGIGGAMILLSASMVIRAL